MDKKTCRTCGRDDFENWDELAQHIYKLSKIKGDKHKKTRWVKIRIHKKAVNKLKRLGKELPYRTPLTDEQKEAKEDTRRELSGKMKAVNTMCPKCNKLSVEYIEVEHAEEPEAWRINDRIVKICGVCSKNFSRLRKEIKR